MNDQLITAGENGDMLPPRKKKVVAMLAARMGLTRLSFRVLAQQMPYIRVLYYHETPRSAARQLEAQLQHYLKRFTPVSREDLVRLLNGERWPHAKPGLIITFDDGLRCNAEVAAPLLERYGFVGWFFVPTDFIDTPPSEQSEFVRNHRILFSEEYPDGRLAMSLAELRTLAEHHQVGCHTASHHRMVADTTDKQLRREIFEARARLEVQIGKAVESFCWVGGEQDTYQTQAAQYVRQAGYRFAFLTNNAVIRRGTGWHELQRTNIEVGWSAEVVDFQMSGLLDFVYWPKRRRVARLISARTTLGTLKEQGNICAIMD